MESLEHRQNEEARRIERRRLEVLYRNTDHFKKWSRIEQNQAYKFKAGVAATKPLFDCLGMIGFSATVFGLASAAYLSEPMNEVCERPFQWSVLLLGFLALITGAFAFRPVGHWAMMEFAALRKSSLAPYVPRVAGQQRTGLTLAIITTVVAYSTVFALAYGIAQQIASRVPDAVCVGPLP
ncbi:MAG: hypothetical protein AB7L90_20900 [Hyphomicrobiaceae bacterium]